MAGVMPKTGYLLVRSGVVVGEFESRFAAINSIGSGLSMTDEGVVLLDGDKQLPNYSLKAHVALERDGWEKVDALRDWCLCHCKLPYGYRIYRYLV